MYILNVTAHVRRLVPIVCQCAFAAAITSGTLFAGAISEVGDGANVIISESPPFVRKPT
jgi:hypothetical protein